MDKLIQMMLTAFANNFTFYLKAHNFHWTVMGPDFPEHHEFLGDVYESAQKQIDEYAEQLRRIGAFPQGDFRNIVNNASLSDPPSDSGDVMAMYQSLLDDSEAIVASLQDTYDEAGTVREYGLQNFLADEIDRHRKLQWMLKATLVPEEAISVSEVDVEEIQLGQATSPEGCPIATQDIGVNLENRQTAIDTANYGPLNPMEPNRVFWMRLADKWSVTQAEAQKSRCGNCAAFNQTTKVLDCIDQGLAAGGATGDEWDTVDAGDLGYCEAFDFKCASSRVCDAWIVGGPIVD